MKKFLKALFVLSILNFVCFGAFASAEEIDFGASGALTKETHTLDEMITYAIQDEYLSRAQYEKNIELFGTDNPFPQIKTSEEHHIAMLKPLFTKYGISLPQDTGRDHVLIPNTLLEAYKTCIDGEIKNIAMYDAFLAQKQPDDVRYVLTKLRNASQHHLQIFQTAASELEGGSTGDSSGGGMGGGCRGMR